jgi:NADH-quinone oxidoreductase subunit A
MKLEPFECGATAIEQVNVKAVPVKYYAIAIVFILFDLETVFLFLWALGAQPLTGGLLVALGVFMVLLVVIMLYVWRTGLLEEVTQ